MIKKAIIKLEQEELHKIIKEYFNLDSEGDMESDTNAGQTTFNYTDKKSSGSLE